MIGHGVSSFSSHSCAAGRTVPSAKPCTHSRMSFWSWLSSREKLFSSVCSCSSAAVVAMSPRGGDAPRGRLCRLAGPLGRQPQRIAIAAVHADQSPHDESQEPQRQGKHRKVAERGQDRRDVLFLVALQVLLVVDERARELPRGDQHLIEGGAAGGLGGDDGKGGHLPLSWALPTTFPLNLAQTTK